MLGLSTILRRFSLRDGRVWAAFFGTDSWTGKPVTPDTAMQIATFWACVRLIAQTIATLPLGLYERQGDGGRKAASSHPLYALLHDQPNADQTAVEFWEALAAHVLVWGNAFVEISRSGTRIVALSLLRPDLMAVHRTEAGDLRYRFSDPRGLREYGEADIFHVRGFGFGGDLGLSPVAQARQTLGAAMATDEAAARTFGNAMRPGGILTYEGKDLLTPAQREQAKAALIEPFTGTENAGKTLLLEGAAGFKWQAATIPPKDAEMLATRAFHIEEICRWFGVPPILVGHNAQGTTMWGSGVEQVMLGWLTLGLRPYLSRIEQAIKRQLIAPGERASLYAEFTVEGLLRADSAGRAEMYSKLLQIGAITPNQIADRENLPRFDGGDQRFVNATLVPIEQAGQRRTVPAPGDPIPEASS
ncbi:phage portal protein [Enterovirga rhinocerotis]|uniref:HK97 family phage portal protein n=1 Tax=Enterovirga rhinocerotis TaxID=1339210 RepID=A0A4V3DXN1_9HYPH|nr:phage portal protein [Enterovirga rhinocerotis]TDR89119.1 HK97 family phage portal protein [Enterovirga rhinocerotis]